MYWQTLVKRCLLGCLLMLLGVAGHPAAAAPRTSTPAPRLVIEAGGHKAIIRALLFTADGRELVSVSDDKTIRVWTVSADGRRTTLARTIRGQIEDGRAGMLAAADLSPPDRTGQQRWLAVGGHLAGPPAERYAIRLHNYATGAVQALLLGHSDDVLALAFAPSGRWLASAGKDTTIRLWDLTSLQGGRLTRGPIELRGHANHIYDLAWSATGDRLASASYDRTVGLWDMTLLSQGQARRVALLQGHTDHVRTVAFHPTAGMLVSGAKDKTIRHWRAQDGTAQGVLAHAKHKVSALAFSPDGRLLLAGNFSPPHPKEVTLFAYPSGKMRQVFTGHQNLVIATAFHPSGQWVATGGGDHKEILLWHVATGQLLSRLEGQGRTINAVAFAKDGRTISWGYTSRYKTDNARGPLEHRLDLTRFARVPGGLPRAAAIRAQERLGKVALATEKGGEFQYTYRLHIRRRGKKLGTITRDKTNGYRHSAYTLTPDGQGILSGGLNGVLQLYALDGTPRATLVGHTGEITALAVSADGHWAVSGSVDQTMQVWSLQEAATAGRAEIPPTFTLFPAANGEWIAWTPEGFFAASEHGAQLIGYSVNQGLRATAKYVSSEQLYDRFYRPDLLLAKLQDDPIQLWQQEGAQTDVQTVLATSLPPQVTFVTPAPHATITQRDTEVQARVTDQGGGIGKVVWQVDGITVAALARGLERISTPSLQQATVVRKQVTLSPGANTITVTAYDRQNNVASAPAHLTVQFVAPLPPVAAAPLQPALHMVVVGINRYRDRALWLNFAVPDGQAFMTTLRTTATPLVRAVHVQELFDERATLSGFEAAFTDAAARVTADDVFILYLAGHGVTLDGRYHFLPQDFHYTNEDAIRRHAINQDHLQRWLASVPARKSVVLIDTCESGSFAQPFALVRGIAEKTAVAKLGRATGRATIVASTDTQPALEGYKGHGVFTYVLLQALRNADTQVGDRDGYTGLFELAAYIGKHVPKLTLEQYDFEQIPQVYMHGSDFPLGVVKAILK